MGVESKEKHVKDLRSIKEETHQEMPLNKEKSKQYLSCLDSNKWLNDETINEYMQLVGSLDMDVFIYTSFFHTAYREGGFKRVKNDYRKYELLDYREL